MNIPIHENDHLTKWLEFILDAIPNKDAEIEIDQIKPEFFEGLSDGIRDFELALMQLAKRDYHLNRVFREAARRLLTDSDAALNMATRVFIADLLALAPIEKPDGRTAIVRDVMIVCAVMILQHMGYYATRNNQRSSPGQHEEEKLTGCYVVFEYLALRRQLSFADNAETVQRAYFRGLQHLKSIGLEHLIPSDGVPKTPSYDTD